jgi:hypothetical protein
MRRYAISLCLLVTTVIMSATSMRLAGADSPVGPAKVADLQTIIQSALSLKSTPPDLTPPVSRWASLMKTDYAIPGSDCLVQFDAPTFTTTNCGPYGSSAAKAKNVILTGDSTALMWLPAIDYWGKLRNFKVYVYIKGACHPWPTAGYYIVNSATGGFMQLPSCPTFNAWVMGRVAQLKPAYIIATGGRVATAPGNWEYPGLLKTELQTYAKSLSPLGVKLLWLEAGPREFEPGLLPTSCILRHAPASCAFPASNSIDTQGVTAAMLASVSANKVSVVPVDQLLCLATMSANGPVPYSYSSCPVVVNKTLVFLDAEHISTQWASYVQAAFASLMPTA